MCDGEHTWDLLIAAGWVSTVYFSLLVLSIILRDLSASMAGRHLVVDEVHCAAPLAARPTTNQQLHQPVAIVSTARDDQQLTKTDVKWHCRSRQARTFDVAPPCARPEDSTVYYLLWALSKLGGCPMATRWRPSIIAHVNVTHVLRSVTQS